MNISQLAPSVSASQTMTQIDFAVLSKGLDLMEQTGDSIIKLMEQSVQPNLGQNIDISL